MLFSSTSTLLINKHILTNSKGSCDTEDWSDDAEYSALTLQE